MSQLTPRSLIHPTDEAAAAFFARGIKGPVSMLNLLRFRERAEYAGFPELKPPSPISGREPYARYIQHTLSFLREGGAFFIGPPGPGWDLAMLVRQDSVASFMSFASNQDYLAGIGHRVAAVCDSRILPLVDVSA